MVNQYSANRRNLSFCCNNTRNQLAAIASEHNLQYTCSPGNIQSSTHRRNGQSKSKFKNYLTFRHYGRGRSRNEQNSKLDASVVLDEWNTNTNKPIRSHANLNKNCNLQHKNFHNYMEVAVSKDYETEFEITHGNRYWCKQTLENNDTEEDLAESCQISPHKSPSSSPTYAHGDWKWLNVESNNDSEEKLTTNKHISDGSLNHVHTNCNCQDQSHDCSDSEKDLDVNSESSYTNCRQDIEITMQEGSEQSEIEDDSILQTDNTLDEQTENTTPAGNETTTIYVFKIMKQTNNRTYCKYISLPLDEGMQVAIRHQGNENLADDWIQDNAGEYEIQDNDGEDENQYTAGLAEEAISKQLQTRIYNKYANKGNWEADSLMDAEEPAVCVICQLYYEDAETLGSLQCGHEYHADCIRKWLVHKNNCPVCKYTILVGDET